MNKETIKQINENLKELEIGFKQAEEHYNYDLGNEKHYLSEVTRLVKNLSLSGVVSSCTIKKEKVEDLGASYKELDRDIDDKFM